jgi:hypothetical protein
MRLCTVAVVTVVVWLSAGPAARADDTGDYTPQAAELYRVAACGGDAAIPQRLDKRVIDKHCDRLRRLYTHHRGWWIAKAKTFIAKIRPADAPNVVVYPFGGGDLSSALAVFPDATEITTLSLEPAGDVRTIDTVGSERLAADLKYAALGIRKLYNAAYSATVLLQDVAKAELPGTLIYILAGLALHDMEPVRLRYFRIEADGTLSYTTSVSGSVEIEFRPRGTPNAPVRIYRHIDANLDDAHTTATSPVMKHLAAKGRVSVMTKAASFLLWRDDFSTIRDYILTNAGWMISDATGIPPKLAAKAGFAQDTYGDFAAPYFTRDPKNVRKDMIALWKDQPHRDLKFRFGYPDKQEHNHLLVMRRAAK